MTQPASTRGDGATTQRKATLFCWECEHSSPVDGDWVLEPSGRHVAYVCPNCETTLTKRPRPTEPTRERTPIVPTTAWRRAIRASTTVWRATVDIGLSSLTILTGVGHVSGVRTASA